MYAVLQGALSSIVRREFPGPIDSSTGPRHNQQLLCSRDRWWLRSRDGIFVKKQSTQRRVGHLALLCNDSQQLLSASARAELSKTLGSSTASNLCKGGAW